MMWGAFSYVGKKKLGFLEGNQNILDYIYTSSEYLLPFAHLHYGIGFIFQQENVSIHSSKVIKVGFKNGM